MLSVDADYLAIRALGPWLRRELADAKIDADAIAGTIELAVHEIATNSIDHAEATTIQFSLDSTARLVTIVVADDGAPAEEKIVVTAPEAPQVRGYGLMIVEQLAHSVEYVRRKNRNEWRLTFEHA